MSDNTATGDAEFDPIQPGEEVILHPVLAYIAYARNGCTETNLKSAVLESFQMHL